MTLENYCQVSHRPLLTPCSDPVRLSALLERINEALDESPAPAHEWRVLQGTLGLELLARLLGISHSSARCYLSGSRPTPDTVAVRLHFLAFVVGDLAGAYNDIGVRRWFDRPRKRLDGGTPAQTLVKAGCPKTKARVWCGNSPPHSCRHQPRDRIPARRPPFSLPSGGRIEALGTMERRWGVDPLFHRYTRRRLGRVPSP